MNIIRRFTLRSLKQNRRWSVVTIIGIIISTAMITAVATFVGSFMALMQNEVIARNGNWHAAFLGVKKDDIAVISENNNIKEYMLSCGLGYSKLEGSKNEYKPYIFIQQYDSRSLSNFNLKLVEGRLPENESEIVLSLHMETNGGVKYETGDVLNLEIGRRMTQDSYSLDQNISFQKGGTENGGPQPEEGEMEQETFVPEFNRTFTVVGIVERPGSEPYWAPGYTAVTYLDESSLSVEDKTNVYIQAKKVNKNLINDMTELGLGLGLPAEMISLHYELLRYYGVVPGQELQKVIYGFASVIIAIIIVASVSLIYNAFAISVSERTRQLGMLASIGATRKQKRRNVYFEALIIGAIGIPIGIIAGISGIGLTLQLVRPLMESFTRFESAGLKLVVSPLSIAAAVIFSALTIWISAWIPARKASKIMPIDALRQTKEIKLTRRAIRTSGLSRKLFGFEGDIALKNLKRSRKKYRATVLSLIISLVLFLTVSYYAEFGKRASSMTTEGYNFNLRVTFILNAMKGNSNEIINQITALDLATDFSIVRIGYGRLELEENDLSEPAKIVSYKNKEGKYDHGAELICLDSESFDKYAGELGLDPSYYRKKDEPRAIAVNYGQDRINNKRVGGIILDMNPGDELTFKYYTPDGDVQLGLEIGELTDKRPMGVIIPTFYASPLIVSEEVFDAFEALLPEKSYNINNNIFFMTEDSFRLEEQITEISKTQPEGSIFIYNISANEKRESDMLLFFGIFIYGFIILISLICIANIFNTVTTNVALRRKEYAMLRSVGMTPRSFSRMIRFESVFYGLKALLYGLPISLAVSLLLYKMQGNAFDFGFFLPWKSYIAAIFLVFVIVLATMLYSGAKIKKENIIDALKEE